MNCSGARLLMGEPGSEPGPGHQGSVIGLATCSGARLSVNREPAPAQAGDEWGTPDAINAGRFQYTGQAWLSELGLYHYKARLYSPALGRFLQVDPVGYDDQINLYAYVGNDPVNGRDPTGRWGCGTRIRGHVVPGCDPGDDTGPRNSPMKSGQPTRSELIDRVNDLSDAVDEFFDHQITLTQQVLREIRKDPIGAAEGLSAAFPGAGSVVRSILGFGKAARGLGGNPFKGKSASEIGAMLERRGFTPRGTDPVSGAGTYVHPRTGRGYHIDSTHGPPKGPHVGVHRPRDKRDTWKPRDYPMEDP